MPFEPSPKISVNPWIAPHLKEASALADLAMYLRTSDVAQHWDFGTIWDEKRVGCGTAGCAVGHAPDVPSCFDLGISRESQDQLNNAWVVFNLPKSQLDRVGGNIAHDFFSCGSYGDDNAVVTPAMVADRIEHWLATGEIR